MACYSCRSELHTYAIVRFTCETCDKHKPATKRKLDEANATLEVYKSKLTFLCLTFDRELRDENRKGDVVLVIQGKTEEALHAHKYVLATRSAVFSKMFEIEMLERETGVVHIDDATLPVMRAVIKFCYDADISFTDEVTGEDVLVVAHKYQITLLHKICEEHLVKTLNNDNLAKRLRLAKRCDAPGLESAASKYFKDNFDSVVGAVLAELC
ncbi:unnamed protein product [Calypogeia fissa]